MKRSAMICLLIFICLTATTTAAGQIGQKGCEFNIVGTWKLSSPEANPVFYRFGADATVTVLSPSTPGEKTEFREVASAVYTLDNPKTPKVILFKAAKEGGGFEPGTTAIDITGYDDMSFTSVKPGSAPIRWLRVDSHRYFIGFAGHRGTFYDGSGPAFPLLIKLDGQQTLIDAIGVYAVRGNGVFGRIPAPSYESLMKDTNPAESVMLRLEITVAQYERGLKILQTWDKRAREGALLYPDPFMNNILLVKQITESLNQCGEKFNLLPLDWGPHDHISDGTLPSHIPFLYFKELRRLNESLHVRDEGLRAAARTAR